jgi:DNA excision repair protein ERCC-4
MLPVGDVAIGTRILVERKTLVDLGASVADGRLFRQAWRLAGSAPRPLVVVEGVLDPPTAEESGLTPNMHRGVLLSLMTGYGIPVLRTRSIEDTAETLAHLARQETRRREARPDSRREADPRRAPQEAMLAALPGLGVRRAAALLAEFGSVRAVLGADAARLRRVEGIGAAMAGFLASLGRRDAEPALPAATPGARGSRAVGAGANPDELGRE